MNKIIKLATIACMMAAASNSMAAGPAANVKVSGTVTVGACVPVLSNNGEYDMGTTTVDQLSPAGSDAFALPVKNATLIITCNTPTKFTFSLSDNRADSVSSQYMYSMKDKNGLFGLGKTSAGVNIGSWYPTFNIGEVNTSGIDGVPGDTILSADKIAWTKAPSGSSIYFFNGNAGAVDYVSFADEGSIIPRTVSNLTMNLTIKAGLSSELKSINDVETLDGNASINIDYL